MGLKIFLDGDMADPKICIIIPYREGVLLPSAEASSGPIVHPQLNP